MKVLGIMQNAWVRDPGRVKAALEGKDEAFRRRYLARLMFACGGLSGRVLLASLGSEWVNLIEWEEASREIGGHSASKFKPDPEHIRKVMEEVKPSVVVCFGSVARGAFEPIRSSFQGVELLITIHPASRSTHRLSILCDLRRKLDTLRASCP